MEHNIVVLISCSKLKLTYPCEARLLYTASNLFSKSLAYAQILSSDNNIYVISAKYGLVRLDETIAPYDESLNDKSPTELSDWGIRTAEQIAMLYDIHKTEFIILAGRNYYAPLQAQLPNIKLPLLGLPMGERLARLNELLRADTTNQSSICYRLHKLFNTMPRFKWDTISKIDFDSGIYVVFEVGESYCGMDRIVRVGTHRSDGRLRSRLKDHFIRENKDGSIFRKNIGKAILNKNHHPYLDVWTVDTSKPKNVTRLGSRYDPIFQSKVEKQVTKYMRAHFTFICFPVATERERLHIEEGIIAALHLSRDFSASPSWRGKYSPEYEIVQSGMWLKQGLDGIPLTEKEFANIAAAY
ncbi:MAG: hypothetical protein FWG72_04925 [Oscillospiraceae bacterium]|nr:hypothetical protein [Oscillospiraceae bacterium]